MARKRGFKIMGMPVLTVAILVGLGVFFKDQIMKVVNKVVPNKQA